MPGFSLLARNRIPPQGGITIDPDEGANKNWNPGQYIEESATASFATCVSRLRARQEYKGIMVRKEWSQLEGAMNDYSQMDDIQNKLNEMRDLGNRHLIVFIQIKTFGGTGNSSVPAYLRNSSTYASGESYTYVDVFGVTQSSSLNGEYIYGSNNGGDGGRVPNLHVTSVKNRFIALFDEFGRRFNDNPYLEAVVFSEAEITQPLGSPKRAGSTPGWQQFATGGNKWWNNMTDVFISMKTSLSNIQKCQWVNSPRWEMEWWVPEIVAEGIGLGMTDGCRNDHGFNIQGPNDPGNIWHMNQHAGKALMMVHMSHPSQEGSVAAYAQGHTCVASGNDHTPYFPGPSYTRQSCATWAKDTVKASHVVWIASSESQSNVTLPVSKTPATRENWCNLPAIYPVSSDVPSGSYAGKKKDLVTDNWIKHASSDISTQEARPPGWT